MQECRECSNKFRYKDIMKSIWINGYYAPMVCDKCNTKHYVSFSTRLILSLSVILPIVIVNISKRINYRFFNVSLILYIIWAILIIALTPFYAKYYVKDDDKDKVLLVSNLKNTEAEIIISILKSYEIPYLKKSNEIGSAEILIGSNLYGIDIYVQPNMLETAKELINTDNIVSEQEDIDN